MDSYEIVDLLPLTTLSGVINRGFPRSKGRNQDGRHTRTDKKKKEDRRKNLLARLAECHNRPKKIVFNEFSE